ncbi:hypothetical protein ACDQ55_20765 [Chitinophaga sp. 30R24]|uniref:hypothetical protein n=1 Tax=Chitinophaga sp. 30R24 TaxID=3248838 RepID=UPI003B8F9A2A
MKKFSLPIYNRLKNGDPIILELTPSLNMNRRWMGIYSYKEYPVQEDLPNHKYSIYDFEVSIDKLEEYFGPNDITNSKRYYVNNGYDLFLKLNELNADPSLFTYPWKCDYPL